MEFVITLPFAFVGIVLFCFMEWEKFRENIKNWWAVYFAIIVFAGVVLYQSFIKCSSLYPNVFIAGATIIGIVYSAIYNKISLENSNKSHRETLEATNKIHRDNLEFQKRVALRKERLELIEEIKKEFNQEVIKCLNSIYKDTTSSIERANLESYSDYCDMIVNNNFPINQLKKEFGNFPLDIKNRFYKYLYYKYCILEGNAEDEKVFNIDDWLKYAKNCDTFSVTIFDELFPEKHHHDEKHKDFEGRLERLSLKNFDIKKLLPFEERFNIAKAIAELSIEIERKIFQTIPELEDVIKGMKEDIKSESLNLKIAFNLEVDKNKIAEYREELENRIIKYKEECFENKIKPIFDEMEKELDILKLATDVGSFLHQHNSKILNMSKNVEAEFNKEINKLLEQSKLE